MLAEAKRAGKGRADQKKRRGRAARHFAAEEKLSLTEAQGAQEKAKGKKTGGRAEGERKAES